METSASGPAVTWTYRFVGDDGSVLETVELADDRAAEDHGRDVSRRENALVKVERRSRHVESWEYVTEADERE